MLDAYLENSPESQDGRTPKGKHIADTRLLFEEWEAIFFIVLMGYCPINLLRDKAA